MKVAEVRKPEQRRYLTVRLPVSTLSELAEEAKREVRSPNSLGAVLIIDGLKRRKEEARKTE